MLVYRTSEPDELLAFIADCCRKNPKKPGSPVQPDIRCEDE